MKIRRKKTLIKYHLKPITSGDIKGFTLSQIQKYLNPQQFIKFRSWIIGQTVGVYRNKTIIYEHDFKQFMADLPPLD